MRVKRFCRILTAIFLMLTILFVNYANDIDSLFGIRAYATEAEDRSRSMLDFYKSGNVLDKSKITSTELYVFGVFLSNFLMPFQTQIGSMANDTFTADMAATFFGDAYTAQQFSDMKYTIGLVQSAQTDRRKIINVADGTALTWSLFIENFGGFSSIYKPTGAEEILYTYEGCNDKATDIVWRVNNDVFDAVIGQLLSVCPTQAGYYAGNAGHMTVPLYIDCFGNMSDGEGTLLIPACMNPYAFYNRALDSKRQIKDNPESTASMCPIQLPIHNAFWMGNMVEPQELYNYYKNVILATDTLESSDINGIDDYNVAYNAVKIGYWQSNSDYNTLPAQLTNFSVILDKLGTFLYCINDPNLDFNDPFARGLITIGAGMIYTTTQYNLGTKCASAINAWGASIVDKRFCTTNTLPVMVEGVYLTEDELQTLNFVGINSLVNATSGSSWTISEEDSKKIAKWLTDCTKNEGRGSYILGHIVNGDETAHYIDDSTNRNDGGIVDGGVQSAYSDVIESLYNAVGANRDSYKDKKPSETGGTVYNIPTPYANYTYEDPERIDLSKDILVSIANPLTDADDTLANTMASSMTQLRKVVIPKEDYIKFNGGKPEILDKSKTETRYYVYYTDGVPVGRLCTYYAQDFYYCDNYSEDDAHLNNSTLISEKELNDGYTDGLYYGMYSSNGAYVPCPALYNVHVEYDDLADYTGSNELYSSMTGNVSGYGPEQFGIARIISLDRYDSLFQDLYAEPEIANNYVLAACRDLDWHYNPDCYSESYDKNNVLYNPPDKVTLECSLTINDILKDLHNKGYFKSLTKLTKGDNTFDCSYLTTMTDNKITKKSKSQEWTLEIEEVRDITDEDREYSFIMPRGCAIMVIKIKGTLDDGTETTFKSHFMIYDDIRYFSYMSKFYNEKVFNHDKSIITKYNGVSVGTGRIDFTAADFTNQTSAYRGVSLASVLCFANSWNYQSGSYPGPDGVGYANFLVYSTQINVPIDNDWAYLLLPYNATTAVVQDGVTGIVAGKYNSVETSNSTALRLGIITLPNLYGRVDTWSKSSTKIMGIDSYDGPELGVFFSSDIATAYRNAWLLANQNTIDSLKDKGNSNDKLRYLITNGNEFNYADPWLYSGGIGIPINLVLDDIALFDTYNNFSESIAETIRVRSMYRDTSNDTAVWWALDSIYGTAVRSVMDEWLYVVEKCIRDSVGATEWTAQRDAFRKVGLGENKNANKRSHYAYSTAKDDLGILSKYYDIVNTKLFPNGGLSQEAAKFAWINSANIGIRKSEVREQFIYRSIAALVTGDYVWLVAGSDDYNNSDYDGNIFSVMLMQNGDGATISVTDTNNASLVDYRNEESMYGKSMTNSGIDDAVPWNGTIKYSSHYFLQKAHIHGSDEVTTEGWAVGWINVLCVIGAVAAIALCVLCTPLASLLPALLVAGTVKVAVVAVTVGIAATILKGQIWAATRNSGAASSSNISIDSVLKELKAYSTSAYGLDKQVFRDSYASLLVLKNEDSSDVSYGNSYLALPAAERFYASYVYCDDNVTDENTFLHSLPIKVTYTGEKTDRKIQVVTTSGTTTLDVQTSRDISSAYTNHFILYGPLKSLAPSLQAVSSKYKTKNITSNISLDSFMNPLAAIDGLITANSVMSSDVGSYITQDVNMWGGLYYAYMYDILGITFSSKDTVVAAKLLNNFPSVPDNLTKGAVIDFSGLVAAGSEEDLEAKETEQRRALLNKLTELMDTNTSDYRNNLLSSTVDSWIIGVHNDIVGADSSGSIANIGAGSMYTSYSGYITTATLGEMPFTSWLMEHYAVIYAVLIVLIIVMAVCMLLTGHRSLKLTLFTSLSMLVILFVPRVTIDTAVNVANNLAGSVYKDRFNFWAYAQHQQLYNKLSYAKENEAEDLYLLITNMQQAIDYYDKESTGVTLKWMSPKKESYWDALAQIKVEGATKSGYDGLNFSLFTWLFQGQFKQEIYSTDPLATYLYRPYSDIVQTVDSIIPYESERTSGAKPSMPTDDTEMGKPGYVNRQHYAYVTNKGWTAYDKILSTDDDIRPYFAMKNAAGATGGAKPAYSQEMFTPAVSNISYNSAYYVSKDKLQDKDTEAVYLQAYPCIKNSYNLDAAGLNKGNNGYLDSEGGTDSHLKMFYLYTESPYYYFYNQINALCTQKQFSPRELLLRKDYCKYQGDNGTIESTGKQRVSYDTIVDFLDLEGLFTYVIPYLQQSNYYVTEWTDLWGDKINHEETGINRTATGEGGTEEQVTEEIINTGFREDLGGIWKMYSPWVDQMYDTSYAGGRIRVAGKSYEIEDTLNPGAYTDYRNMVFSPADMQRNYLTEADLSNVEKRIMRVLEKTYTDFMYLNNYTNFDNEVLLSAMAMTATFNFNKEFSDELLIGDSTLLYPVSFEIRNFSYDAFLRMTLLNTTGTSIFSETDIYTDVITNTNIFTGLLMILNDLIAVYAVPAMKLILLLMMFVLGLAICVGCFLQPPDQLWKHLGKYYFAPFGIFFAILIAHMIIVAMFVGEGANSIVGQRTVTITTGDPTVTIILLLVVNCLFIYGMFRVLKLLLKSFKTTFGSMWAVAAGLVAGAAAFGMATMGRAGKAVGGVATLGTRAVKGTVGVATGTVGALQRQASRSISNYRRNSAYKAQEDYYKSKKAGSDITGNGTTGVSGNTAATQDNKPIAAVDATAPRNTAFTTSSGSNAPSTRLAVSNRIAGRYTNHTQAQIERQVKSWAKNNKEQLTESEFTDDLRNFFGEDGRLFAEQGGYSYYNNEFGQARANETQAQLDAEQRQGELMRTSFATALSEDRDIRNQQQEYRDSVQALEREKETEAAQLLEDGYSAHMTARKEQELQMDVYGGGKKSHSTPMTKSAYEAKVFSKLGSKEAANAYLANHSYESYRANYGEEHQKQRAIFEQMRTTGPEKVMTKTEYANSPQFTQYKTEHSKFSHITPFNSTTHISEPVREQQVMAAGGGSEIVNAVSNQNIQMTTKVTGAQVTAKAKNSNNTPTVSKSTDVGGIEAKDRAAYAQTGTRKPTETEMLRKKEQVAAARSTVSSNKQGAAPKSNVTPFANAPQVSQADTQVKSSNAIPFNGASQQGKSQGKGKEIEHKPTTAEIPIKKLSGATPQSKGVTNTDNRSTVGRAEPKLPTDKQ